MAVRRGRQRSKAAVAAAALVVGAGAAAVLLPATASYAATTGTMAASGVTTPYGGVWLPGPSGSAGHYWSPDGLLGICRIDSGGVSVTPVGCNNTVKAGGQAAYDSVHQLLWVADSSSTSNQVVRYSYNPATESISGGTVIPLPPPLTATGGGRGGGGKGAGRAASLAVTPDGKTVFVGYITSGDIWAVNNTFAGTGPGTPTAVSFTKVGTSTDGRGTSGGFALLTRMVAQTQHQDLYVGEIGGHGLAVISDITGVAGDPSAPPACGSPSPCKDATVLNNTGTAVSFFPGGVATDGNTVYVGDAPRGVANKLIAYTPATKAQVDWSTSVPSYSSVFDGVTRSTYAGISGVAVAPGGTVYVGDDPTVGLTRPATGQGHLWRVSPPTSTPPTITAVTPAQGPAAGGTTTTITGTNLLVGTTPPTVTFGGVPATGVVCAATGLSCQVTTPAVAGAGSIAVTVTTSGGQSVTAPAAFTYTVLAPPTPTATPPTVTSVSPAGGSDAGGTTVTVTGTDLAPAGASMSISFGTAAATGVTCPTTTSCTATSPPGTAGQGVHVQVTTSTGGTSAISTATPATDLFTYTAQPVADLWAYGITAPKGGMTFVPNGVVSPGGVRGGAWWSSDHVQGVCRFDQVSTLPLQALNSAACDPGFALGSPGQAVYDPTANADGTHYLYVPDDSRKTQGVSRIKVAVDSAGVETLTGQPEALAPGAANSMAGLKPNGLAMGPDGNLYVSDLVDGVIRRINHPAGFTTTQTIDNVAVTQAQKAGGAARGTNGTMAFIGSRLFLPENNAATYIDINADHSGTWVPGTSTAIGACDAVANTCPTSTALRFLTSPIAIFVSGIATDPAHHQVYISSSPGGANATIFRFDANTITPLAPGGTTGTVYVTSGRVPAAGSATATVYCSTTCTRPADPALTPGGTTGFSFAQGLDIDPNDSSLYIGEDVTAGARGGRGHVWHVPYLP